MGVGSTTRTNEAGAPPECPEALSYHALLAEDGDLCRETHRALVQAQQAQGLFVRDRMLCNTLRPRFMSSTEARTLADVSTRLAETFEQVGRQILGNDRLLDRVGASDRERELWAVDPGYPGFTVTSRLDSFLCDGIPHFVEYNAESPASIGFCDSLTDIFLGLDLMQRWPHTATLRRFHAQAALLDTLLWAYVKWGSKERPVIAIIDWDDVVTRRDFELCADYFRSHGLETYIADPRSFHYSNGRLQLDGQVVTIVYRRVLLHELLDRDDEARDLLDAYRDGAVCMVNSPRSKMLHKKSLLALLSDPESGLTLSSEQRSLIDLTIPWTRYVEDTETTCGGARRRLSELAISLRERLALKPSDDYGGKGVVLGWETDEAEWHRALDAAAQKEYVLQERVTVPEASFPVWDGDGMRFANLHVDADPLLFRGKVGGMLTRLSGSALLNVTAGTGSTTATFVMDKDAA